MLNDLIAEIDAHLAWRKAQGRPLAETTFGLRSVDDGKLMSRLRDGKQITVEKMQRIQAWISADKTAARQFTPIEAGRAA